MTRDTTPEVVDLRRRARALECRGRWATAQVLRDQAAALVGDDDAGED